MYDELASREYQMHRGEVLKNNELKNNEKNPNFSQFFPNLFETTQVYPTNINFIEPIFNSKNSPIEQLAVYQNYAIQHQHPLLLSSLTLTPEEIQSLFPPQNPNQVIDCLQFPKPIMDSILPATHQNASLKGEKDLKNDAGLKSPIQLDKNTGEIIAASYNPSDYQYGDTADGNINVPRTAWAYVPTPQFPSFVLTAKKTPPKTESM
jgi:hypothetical protein